MNRMVFQAPPDQAARIAALNPDHSILVQAPAGSGKTDLLTRRFLRLLQEVEEPGQIVAITFTRAAATEMRHRILSELESAAARDTSEQTSDAFSIEALARRALERSHHLNWNLLDLSSQLRISTIDSFCRDLALQQPLLSGLGGNLQVSERPADLYRRAARRTLEKLGDRDNRELSASVGALLQWRDNGWQEMEDLLVTMLGQRDRWMHDFVLVREPDWDALRERLEKPFANAVAETLSNLQQLLGRAPNACNEALELARFAWMKSKGALYQDLAELIEFPCGPFDGSDALEDARRAYACLAELLLTQGGTFRKQVNVANGFPADCKPEKQRIVTLIARIEAIPGMAALGGVRSLPPARYAEDEWEIVRACFTLLRHASAQLKAVFAEAGKVDFVEVAQIAQHVLKDEDGFPTDAALAMADGIRHLLVDEFQDTSRRQHQLLSSLVAAWPDQTRRTVFVVGDPMQSIYFFRDADAELFPRVQAHGLEMPDGAPLLFDFVSLSANFRTVPTLVQDLNKTFEQVFAEDDGSGVTFSPSQPAREPGTLREKRLQLHLRFVPQTGRGKPSTRVDDLAKREALRQREAVRAAQTNEIVELIRANRDRMEAARNAGKKYRIAVLGRTRTVLAPIAQSLRDAKVPFRAVDLENLKDRPEVVDALALARAVLNPQDRIAWLSVLRAPWSGLSLEELHIIGGANDGAQATAPIPQLLAERKQMLSQDSRNAVGRILNATASVPRLRDFSPTSSVGTVLQQIWFSLGGSNCVDATARANLDLFWKLLDNLAEGEQDLFGPALSSALQDLCALPDPATSSDCGVQLMTIHKSKGLEFEIVIVPDMQAGTGSRGKKLLSWLERGVKNPDESAEITEFLVAPLPSKGADRGKAKEWVDRVYCQRESQETRRILYVAATRAREELHLFSLPAYKREKNGSTTLVEPSNSLLATAWPAVEEEVKARFEEWQATQEDAPEMQGDVIPALAASGSTNLAVMPSPPRPALLRRLPTGFELPSTTGALGLSANQELVGISNTNPYERHEGGIASRALGNAVHKLLESLAAFRATLDWESALSSLEKLQPRISAQVRTAGLSTSETSSIVAQAFDSVYRATMDPIGQWVLSPHAQAKSEAGWAGVVAGGLRLVRVDRIFRAGPEPILEGDDTWWIIDFKTAHANDIDSAAALPFFRSAFAPQLEMYAAILRNLHGTETRLRAGLYYPRMALLDWWEA